MAAIEVRDLAISYGELRAVDGISFEVPEGEFFGILGPNGAGKTTTLELVEGLRRPDSGTVSVFGLSPWPRNHALLPRIGVQLQASAFFERLKKGAILINIGRGDLIDEAALRAGLDRDQPGHAVLDVFATEPLPADSWFWNHPKVRVTAHTSNAGDGVMRRGDELFLDNLGRYLKGEPLRNEARKDEVGL